MFPFCQREEKGPPMAKFNSLKEGEICWLTPLPLLDWLHPINLLMWKRCPGGMEEETLASIKHIKHNYWHSMDYHQSTFVTLADCSNEMRPYNCVQMSMYSMLRNVLFEQWVWGIVFDECVNVDSSNRHFKGYVHDHVNKVVILNFWFILKCCFDCHRSIFIFFHFVAPHFNRPFKNEMSLWNSSFSGATFLGLSHLQIWPPLLGRIFNWSNVVGQHSTEVAFALLNQQPQVRILALSR